MKKTIKTCPPINFLNHHLVIWAIELIKVISGMTLIISFTIVLYKRLELSDSYSIFPSCQTIVPSPCSIDYYQYNVNPKQIYKHLVIVYPKSKNYNFADALSYAWCVNMIETKFWTWSQLRKRRMNHNSQCRLLKRIKFRVIKVTNS